MSAPSDIDPMGSPACPLCSKPMTLARTVPRLGPHPELRSFSCTPCRQVLTVPVDRTGNRE